MEATKAIENVKVPNFFYDLIVFITPSLTLILGIFFGLGGFGIKALETNMEFIKINEVDFLVVFIFFFIILLFIAYEYGRLAEALSNYIADLVRFLRKKKILFKKQKDYDINYKKEISKLNLHELLDDDKMDKWTIIYYVMRFQPGIGSDILKRYAWEKLARSSAFTFSVLFLISFILEVLKILHVKHIFGYYFIDTGIFGFGSLAYTLTSFSFFTMTCYEYYRRKSWNNDLLIKILPVIILPNDHVILKSNKETNSEKEQTKEKEKHDDHKKETKHK